MTTCFELRRVYTSHSWQTVFGDMGTCWCHNLVCKATTKQEITLFDWLRAETHQANIKELMAAQVTSGSVCLGQRWHLNTLERLQPMADSHVHSVLTGSHRFYFSSCSQGWTASQSDSSRSQGPVPIHRPQLAVKPPTEWDTHRNNRQTHRVAINLLFLVFLINCTKCN